MTPNAVEHAATLLVAARRNRRPLDALPETCRPRSAEEGYAVQKIVIGLWGEEIAGWKSGATALAIQQRFGLDEPFLGPIFRSGVLHSPAKAEAAAFEHRLDVAKPGIAVEVEFAFRVGAGIAPRAGTAGADGAGAYSESEVLAAMDAMIPAIEIIAPRFHAIPFDPPGSALADCGVNGGIVLGRPIADWRQIDFAAHKTSLVVDGKTVAEGTGGLVLGHPFRSLTWLVNNVTRRGFTLHPGQILTTGSMTGIVYVAQGQQATGDFGSLGKVELHVR